MEGLLFASHHELKNLFVIVDNNKLQAMGSTEKVLDLEIFKTNLHLLVLM